MTSAPVPVEEGKKSFSERLTDLVTKLAGPLIRFADLPSVSSVQNGLVATVPVIIVGSFFLILYVLGSPSVGASGQPLLPFLAPLATKFLLVFQLTLGIMALYASITIAMNYAERLKVEVKTAAVLGLAAFILFTMGTIENGMISISSFGASGLFVAILTSLTSIRLYKFLVDRNITIKLPDSVPPNIGNAFTALIPFLAIFTVAWFVRTVLGFDMVTWLTTVLGPIIQGADNLGVYALNRFLTGLLWSVGLHGDNMLLPIFQPLQQGWSEANASALAAGVSPNNLPHVWTLYGLDRLTYWPATVWPVIILMFMSKVKSHRALATAATPAAIFTIVEPVIYGLPLALNPFLLIPFLLTSVVSGVVTYLAFSLHMVDRYFAVLPWATPPFISGPLGTGDWRTLILLALNIAIGFVIYLPFFKIYEKHELQIEAQRAAEEEAEAQADALATQTVITAERVAAEADRAVPKTEARV